MVNYSDSTKGEDYDLTKFRALNYTFLEPHVSDLHKVVPLPPQIGGRNEEGRNVLTAFVLTAFSDKAPGEEAAVKQDNFIVSPMFMGLCDDKFKGKEKETRSC